ncbi:hypothetical protein F4859DRAFT_524797 [Xylaria cf. heliscus]|nr:hypothetical protein F4859DRAFT_524797 [Xylaria cf. heliscus]
MHGRTGIDPDISSPYLGSQALLMQSEDRAAQWEQCASHVELERNQSQDDIQPVEEESYITDSRYDEPSRLVYPSRRFNPRTHPVVSHSFATRAREAHDKIQSLEKEINEKTVAYESVVSLWQDALEELDEVKSSKKSLTIDDDEMASKWKQLQFVARSLSTSYLYGLATSHISSVTAEDLDRYLQLMPASVECPDEGTHSYLCQIQIWDFITTRILSVPTIIWGQEVFESTEKLFTVIAGPDRNKISASDFHTFRAQTGEMIKNGTQVDVAVCDKLKTELKEQLRPFTPPENAQEVSRQLDVIIDKAVDLALVFTQSRCFYHVRPMDRRHKRLFDPKTMDNVGYQGSPYAHSVISPIFFKYGNSKGENYGQGLVLAKAAVLC